MMTPDQQTALQHCRELITSLSEEELFAPNEDFGTRVPTPREELLALLDGGAPNARDERGETLLHKVDNPQLIRALLEAGADPNARDDMGMAPLHHVCNTESMQLLLAAGANARARDNNDLSTLHRFPLLPDWAQLLVQHGADAAARSRSGLFPLYDVQDVETARFLVEHGARPEVPNSFGRNELFSAGVLYCPELVRFYVEQGCAPNTPDMGGQTPLHYHHNGETVAALLACGANPLARFGYGRTPLHESYWSEDKAQLLLAAGVDPNVRDERGNTPLHSLLMRPEVAAALLRAGADPNAENNAGETPLNHNYKGESADVLREAGAEVDETPLHWACEENDAERVRELLELGATPWCKALCGQTPVCRTTSAEIVGLLKEAGADLDEQDVDGDRPLHWANTELTRALLEHGADPNAVNDEGQTPLHVVQSVEKAELLLAAGASIEQAVEAYGGCNVLFGQEDAGIIEWLIAHGASVHHRNEAGETPLHWAHTVEVAACLLRHGADPLAQDAEGNTPEEALEEFHGEVAAWLRQRGEGGQG